MVEKTPTKKMGFTDQDEDFIRQLSGDIGCYYRKTNERTYSLNKCDSDVQGQMGVFAWVHKEDDDYFWVTTRRAWVEEARTTLLAGRKTAGTTCFPRLAQQGDSVCFDTRNGYQNTISALKIINNVR